MERGDGTRCVHAGLPPVAAGEPVPAQPVLTTQYHLADDPAADSYGRAGNPTWRALESAIGELDGGTCVVYPSGMAAVSALLRTAVQAGETVVVPSDGYYLARRYAHEYLPGDVREVPTTSSSWDFTGARLVLVETPSNPGLDVCDIEAVVAAARAAGALVAVDNTTPTPLGQRPLELGADFTVASDTKALAGHSDVVLGHISTASSEWAERLLAERTVSGAVPGPFETWLALRGLGTLDLRLARQAENAAAVYAALRGHPRVARVRWPGAQDDPAHAIASRQMRRFGGVLTIELASAAEAEAFTTRSELIASATSFGGLHTTADRRERWGDAVHPGLLRVSCGCEDPDDLVADILAALG